MHDCCYSDDVFLLTWEDLYSVMLFILNWHKAWCMHVISLVKTAETMLLLDFFSTISTHLLRRWLSCLNCCINTKHLSVLTFIIVVRMAVVLLEIIYNSNDSCFQTCKIYIKYAHFCHCYIHYVIIKCFDRHYWI